jgi:hypothetical protein
VKLVIELKVLPHGKKRGKGVTTFHEVSRALRSLCRDFDHDFARVRGDFGDQVWDYDAPKGDEVVGKWKVKR